MTQQLTKQQKGGIAIAVVLAIVIVLLVLLWPRKSSAATATEEAKPIIEPVPVVLSPNPYAPKTTPTQGEYYIPRKNDSDSRICQEAGLTPVLKAKIVLRDHPNNDWIAKTNFLGARQLDLDWGYARMEGHASQDWAWKTAHVGSGGRAICIVYVPTQKEVDAA